jgi:hypothetical protein
MTPDESFGQAVTQPPFRAADNLNMCRLETNFFFQFPIHSLYGRLTLADTALGKLPGALPDPFGPQQMASRIAQDDTYVSSKTLRVDHLNIKPYCI